MRIFFFCILFVSSFCSCKNGLKTSKKGENCKPLTIVAVGTALNVAKDVEVVKAYLKSDDLVVRTKYLGCATTEINLVHNGKVKKSLPPQVSLVLERGKENCDETTEIENERCFDIGALKAITTSGKVVIRIQNYPETLVYEY